MNAVVERCPNCGVEHDRSHVGPCEVCGSELRYWCQRHSQEIGWLDDPQCPRCAHEAEVARRTPPPAPPPRPPRRPAERRPPVRTATRPAVRRDPREVLREGAGDILPHVATGASLAFRLIRAVFVLVRTVLLWAVLGAAAGVGYAFLVGGDLMWLAVFGLMNGAGIGLLLGMFLALRSLLTRREPRTPS